MSSSEEIPGGPLWCPHFQKIDERTLRQLFSKVAAVRSENRELFDFTHRRIEVFRGTSTEDTEKWGEERVYQLFSEDELGNFVVVIEGEVGTGKSELCAYLSHQLNDDGRPILHIDKDDDLMSILSECIPEFYQEHFEEPLPGASEFKQLRDDITNNPQTVANNATSGALLNLGRQGYETTHTREDEEAIRDFIQEKLHLLVERGEYAREIKFITEGEYKQQEELRVFSDQVSADEAVESFNKELWREIRDRYDTASLDDVLEYVGSQFEDTRPVIVFEDFAIASMEAERLRNYMERDKPDDNWDFIVAGTRDSTEVLHTRTAEDRFEFFQTNKRHSKNVLFLDEPSAVDFARPYLGYIKAHDDSVRYDRENGDFELLPAPDGSLCAECGFCDEAFRDLFPFNQAFLRRIYTGLDESQQSPREYIMEIFEVLEEWYEGHAKAPSSASSLRRLRNTVSAADEAYEEAEEFADLAKWYGSVEDDQITVDRRFAEAFHLLEDGAPAVVDVTDDGIIIPSAGVSPSEPEIQGEQTEEDDEESSSTDQTTTSEKSRVEKLIEKHNGLVDSWLENPEEYAKTNRFIRQGLRDAIEHLTDGFKLYEGTKLEYRLSSQKDPFVYVESDDSPEIDQILLDRRDFRRSDLRKILKYGIRRVEEPRSADVDSLLTECGTQLMYYALEWRQMLIEEYLNGEKVFYKGSADYDFTDFVLATYVHLVMLDSPWRNIDATAINERFSEADAFSVDPHLEEQITEILSQEEYDHIKTAMDSADHIEAMVGKLLGVSGGSLDVPKIRRRLGRNPPYEVLDMLGRQYIAEIDSRVRFGQEAYVRSIADTMYDVRQALEEVADHGYDRELIEEINSEFSTLNMTRVSELVSNLRTYDNVNPDLQQELTKFVDFSQADVDMAVEAANTADTLRMENTQDQIQAALISLKLAATPVVKRFRSVPIDGASSNGGHRGGLGERFKEVSDHYVS